MLHRSVLNPGADLAPRRPRPFRGGGRTGSVLRPLLSNRGGGQKRAGIYRDSGSTVKPIGASNNRAAPITQSYLPRVSLPGTHDPQFCPGQPRWRFPRDRMCVAHRS